MDKARFDELTAGELAERLGQLRFDRGDPPPEFLAAALLLGRGLDLMDDDRALADDTPETEWVCQMAHLLADRLRLDTPSIEARLNEDGVLTPRYAAMARVLKSRQGRQRRRPE